MKPDFKGILKNHLYLYKVDKPVIDPKYLEVEIIEAMKEVWNKAIEEAASDTGRVDFSQSILKLKV